MQKQYQRQTAYKVWIADLVKNEIFRDEGEFGVNYVLIDGKKVSRVNLMGFVVERYYNEVNHLSFVLDDKSGRIRLKIWNEDVNLFRKMDIGDFVLVIGKLKAGIERYIAPEIIRLLNDPLWGRLRHAELTKIYGKPIREEGVVEVNEERSVGHNENLRQKVLIAIERFDNGDGADFNDVVNFVNRDGFDVRAVLDNLIKEGEIFSKEGRFKLVG